MARGMESHEIDVHEIFDVLVVGGGSAGLAAAVAAAESGAPRVLVLEREDYLGGVLPQCVHDGFGLYLYGASLTGPEYARRWERRARGAGVQIALASTVISISASGALGVDAQGGGLFTVDAVGVPLGGRALLRARAVVCATGCRERTRGAMQIPGGRPAGVLTAGSAQYMVNVANQLPGDKVVILGSGDIGLIMARRMVLEGAEVRMVLGQEATGLLRNHIRCIEDFGIPIRYGWGLASVHGYGQLQGVTVAPMTAEGALDMARKEYVRCNVLLVACGLVPEREVLGDLDAARTPGLFVCGNANVAHDLVDQVTQEGLRAGAAAAQFVLGAGSGGADRGEAAAGLPADLARMEWRAISEPKGRLSELHGTPPAGFERIVCTVCPTGCIMEASHAGEVRGNTCESGREYALRELACPTRVFTGTVRIDGAAAPLLPVRTDGPVPKSSLLDVARACRRLHAAAPVSAGDVIASDVAGTGVALVATADREVAHGR